MGTTHLNTQLKTMVKIRSAHLGDCKTVLSFINELENAAFEERKFQWLFKANILNRDILYLLALMNGIPVGFISCHIQSLLHHNKRVGEIQEMFVHRRYRNRGVGTMMLNDLRSRLTKRKIHQLEVASSTKRKLTHRFYTSQKFEWTSKKFVLQF